MIQFNTMSKEEVQHYLYKDFKLSRIILSINIVDSIPKDKILFLFMSGTGAMGIPGRLAMITEEGALYDCNYKEANINPDDILRQIGRNYSSSYLGVGNYLFIRDDIYPFVILLIEEERFQFWIKLSRINK